jgi:hypothetical protein
VFVTAGKVLPDSSARALLAMPLVSASVTGIVTGALSIAELVSKDGDIKSLAVESSFKTFAYLE